MFETLAVHGDASFGYPDIVEDTLQVHPSCISFLCMHTSCQVSPAPQASLDEHYVTAVSSRCSSVAVLDSSQTPNAVSDIVPCPDLNSTLNTVEPRSLNNCGFEETRSTTVSAEVRKLSDSQLREHLISLGEQPGPINESTRIAYMVYLTKLKTSGCSSNTALNTDGKGMCMYIQQVLYCKFYGTLSYKAAYCGKCSSCSLYM